MLESFFVVCADGHGGFGPFETRESAGELAITGSKKTGCQYRVVPITLDVKTLMAVVKNEMDKHGWTE